ncbi:MAG: DNA mismatch repair protein MutS [Defluviitaleaceae bacterium]|nr:DNA mismatch repair protein MutS [Defluviitaleaceae bacterium]MCL2836645.1 DNA mismatch repair protein MutS [Defluviitaleaceae bacterium]
MMEQFMRIKNEHPYCLVFFRLGDFYELFFDDALIASRELDLVLTGRDCGMEERAPMCGVPHHAADGYVARLIEKGYKVAICEQLEDPKTAKTIVKRDVVRVVTPGTILDQNILDGAKNNYVAAVCGDGKRIGIAAADISTGEFYTYSIAKDANKLLDELTRFTPAEVVSPEGFMPGGIGAFRLTERNGYTFEIKSARDILLDHFKVHNLEGFGVEGDSDAIRAAGGLLSYLRETQKISLSHITSVKLYNSGEYLAIDAASRRNLELTESLRDRKKAGSLLWVLDKTKSAMGARALRRWLTEPLTSAGKIETRLDAVEELKRNGFMRDSLREALGNAADIERVMGRVTYGLANARDLLALKRTAAVLPEVKKLLEPCVSAFLSYFRAETDTLPDIHDLIHNSIADDPPSQLNAGGFIRGGYNAELDDFRHAKNMGASLILELEAKERAGTGIKTLKIKYNKVFGYNIEITNSYLHMAPERYKRIQTLSGCERYATAELKEIEERILTADERIASLELELWRDITARISAEVTRIQHAGNALAVIDALQSLAETAERNKYVRPKINTAGIIDIIDGRHPVIERMLDGAFIPNDTRINMETDRLLTLTGPNMAGKSTYMRQVALILVMAQTGSFVPAVSADIGVADKLFTRVGASDDLATGQSTFMVEMAEVSNILNNATKHSLIILDEIGRGTSTYDGMSIAWATLEYIADEKGVGARTLFATHYHEMTELEGKIPGVVNYNVLVRESGENILFLHKIAKGGADRSYGIHVARLAGLPKAVIDRAMEIMEKLNKNDAANRPDTGEPEKSAGNPVHYGTNRRRGQSGNRVTIQQAEDGTHQLSIRDVFKDLS